MLAARSERYGPRGVSVTGRPPPIMQVLLIQKSILRDATTDLSLHYLAKAKIMARGL